MTLNRFDTVVATFNPKILNDLKSGVEKHIGKRTTFMASWTVEDGRYEGQWAMTPTIATELYPCVWVPYEDLDDIELKGD
jgi:hypothetical protein